MHPRAILAPLLLLAACGPLPPPEPPVTLPRSAEQNPVTDPARSAILSTAYVFGRPDTVAGDPAAAAEALARLEFLTVELATGPRWIGMDPSVVPLMQRGRAEARAAFGLDPNAPPQRAMDALFGTAAALRAGERGIATAAIGQLTPPGQAEPTLQRLAALPALPQAAIATARAQQAMGAMDRGGHGRFWRF